MREPWWTGRLRGRMPLPQPVMRSKKPRALVLQSRDSRTAIRHRMLPASLQASRSAWPATPPLRGRQQAYGACRLSNISALERCGTSSNRRRQVHQYPRARRRQPRGTGFRGMTARTHSIARRRRARGCGKISRDEEALTNGVGVAAHCCNYWPASWHKQKRPGHGQSVDSFTRLLQTTPIASGAGL